MVILCAIPYISQSGIAVNLSDQPLVLFLLLLVLVIIIIVIMIAIALISDIAARGNCSGLAQVN